MRTIYNLDSNYMQAHDAHQFGHFIKDRLINAHCEKKYFCLFQERISVELFFALYFALQFKRSLLQKALKDTKF